MKVLLVTDPKIPVPPKDYGGAERIVAVLARELERKGHEVDLLAGPGSQAYGGRLILHHSPGRDFASRAWRKIAFQPLCLRAALRAEVVINFGRLDYLESVLLTSKPLISCFQNPVSQDELNWLISRRRQRLLLVGVSHAQIRDLQPSDLFKVIHNVADLEYMKFSAKPSKPAYLAFLGRITANKGADTAIKVAKRVGMPLKLGGNISDEPGGREFFETSIRPELGPWVEWLGPLNDWQKHQLLAGASGLLFPIRWPEPFGIVMAEALACGTPVIAMRCASTPEIVEPGITGFLCDSEDEMVEAVSRIGEIDRYACRKSAELRFSPQAMVNSYLATIQRLLSI
jgi:glycosyltransferase involved in cell wall biosynthesis